MTAETPTDEELVAYLDGALPDAEADRIAQALARDGELAARLQALEVDMGALRAGFDDLVAGAPALSVPEVPVHEPAPAMSDGFWTLSRAAAVAVVMFGAGLGIGWSVAPTASAPDWHQAVADYQVLYTTATLTAVPMSDQGRAAGLAHVGHALGLALDESDVAIPGLTFQRAQILEHRGAPLAQLAYLDGAGNPVAFCFTRTGGSDQASRSVEISGLNAETWQQGGIGYILIGPAPAEDLRLAGQRLARQVGT